MQPSVSTRSKLPRVASRSTASSVALSATASVVTTASIVARAGASIAAPFAIPPTLQPSPRATDVLATVSVVRIASAAAGPPSASSAGDGQRPRRAAAGPSAAARRSGRSSRPRRGQRRCRAPAATASAVRWVSANPSGPVQAFAPPELSTTASTRPPATTCCDHSTGAALTRLPVKTPAAACSGPSLTTSARSGCPLSLSPAVTPAARKPFGAVTLTGPRRSPLSPAVSGRPSSRLAHCSAWPAAPLPRLSIALTTTARPASSSTVTCSWQALEPSDRGGVRPAALRQQVDERLVGVRRRSAARSVGGASRPSGRCRWPGCRAASARAPG